MLTVGMKRCSESEIIYLIFLRSLEAGVRFIVNCACVLIPLDISTVFNCNIMSVVLKPPKSTGYRLLLCWCSCTRTF